MVVIASPHTLTQAHAMGLLLRAAASLPEQEELARRSLRCLAILASLFLMLFSALCFYQSALLYTIASSSTTLAATAAELREAAHLLPTAPTIIPTPQPSSSPPPAVHTTLIDRYQVHYLREALEMRTAMEQTCNARIKSLESKIESTTCPRAPPTPTPLSFHSAHPPAGTCSALVERVRQLERAECTIKMSSISSGAAPPNLKKETKEHDNCDTMGGTVGRVMVRTGDWIDYIAFDRRNSTRGAYAHGDPNGGDVSRSFSLQTDEHIVAISGERHRHRVYLAESLRFWTSSGRSWGVTGAHRGPVLSGPSVMGETKTGKRFVFHYEASRGDEIIGLRVTKVDTTSLIVGVETQPLGFGPQHACVHV